MVYLLFISMILTTTIFLIISGIFVCPIWVTCILIGIEIISIIAATIKYKQQVQKHTRSIILLQEAIILVDRELQKIKKEHLK